MGNKAWTLKLDWYGADKFIDAPDIPIKSSKTGKKLGQQRSHENFSFLRVFGAGHMVPYDQPEHSLEFLTSWLKNAQQQSDE